MDGEGVITLADKHHAVGKGADVYLGTQESASIRHAGGVPLKLLHLVVTGLAA